jgi:hypothetical protein
MNYARPTFEQITSGNHAEHDLLHARLSAMPPQRVKWFLHQLHLHQKLNAADLAYWLGALQIDPSL